MSVLMKIKILIVGIPFVVLSVVFFLILFVQHTGCKIVHKKSWVDIMEGER